MVFGLPASTASSTELKQKEDKEKVSKLFNSLGLGKDFANQIEQVRRFKQPNETEKVAPIQVTVQMDGNG